MKRIFGLETEYGLTCASTVGNAPPIEPEEAAERLFSGVRALTRSTNTFISNGARLYLDVGAHPEYATAECDQLIDLLANDRAGDEIFRQMAREANDKLAEEGIPGRIHLFKNNLDSAGNSYGSHENYLVRRRRDFRARIDSLIPFFVTRQILVGAGNISSGTFELSQRADQMWDAVSAASTQSRPMINTRDEPHGDAELYRRMHVLVGDSTMLASTTALRFGATEAVLNVLESGVRLPDFTLADPAQAIREISLDITGCTPIALGGKRAGQTASALDIQEEIFTFVRDHYVANGWAADLDPTRRYVFDLWERALVALRANDLSGVDTELDWVAKKKLLDVYRARLGCDYSDPRIARLDLAWHDISDGGLRDRLEASGALHQLLSPAQIAQAVDTPPQTTRAKVRGEFVARAQAERRDYMADWMNIRILTDEGGTRSVLLKDPFAAVDDQVDALMEKYW